MQQIQHSSLSSLSSSLSSVLVTDFFTFFASAFPLVFPFPLVDFDDVLVALSVPDESG
jgi:hypothetical protein